MAEESPTRPLRDAGNASAEGGLVLLEGPDGIAITLTPEAARRTGESLIDAAKIAAEFEEKPGL